MLAAEDGLAWNCCEGPPTNGEDTRGGAGPLGGGGGGVGDARAPPYGDAGGGIERLLWPGKGVVIGAAIGVLRLAGVALVTIGVSFHCSIFLALEGGGADGVVFLGGGAPNDGGGAPYPELGFA